MEKPFQRPSAKDRRGRNRAREEAGKRSEKDFLLSHMASFMAIGHLSEHLRLGVRALGVGCELVWERRVGGAFEPPGQEGMGCR